MQADQLKRTTLTDMELIVHQSVFEDVEHERAAQDQKWGVNFTLPEHQLCTILTEEYLELVRAVNDHASTEEKYNEAIQVAAVAIRFATALRIQAGE